jgi:hypothetical protein
LTVVDPCETTPYIDRTLRNMQIKLGYGDEQDVNIDYQLAKDLGIPNVCGNITITCGNYAFLTKVPGKPSCLLYSVNNDDIDVN